MADKLDDEEDWARNYRGIRLGEKLIELAITFAIGKNGKIFESKKIRETSSGKSKTPERIGLTETADQWFSRHNCELEALASPIHMPMIVTPRPWTTLTEGGYLVTPLQFIKRRVGNRIRSALESADLSVVFAAVNALQESRWRINKEVYTEMRKAWERDHPFFGLSAHTFLPVPPKLDDGANIEDIKKRRSDSAAAYHLNRGVGLILR